MARKWTITFGSDILPHRNIRRRVKALLRRGIEPEPKYRTGKYWTD